MSKLVGAWYAALEGKHISPDDIELAKSELNSNASEQRVMATSILLWAGNAAECELAFQRLVEMCDRWPGRDDAKATAILLIALKHLTIRQLQSHSCFAELTYQAAVQPLLPARINAMHVLRKFAKSGDQRAIQLLKQSTNDSEHYVRLAALSALKLAGLDARKGRSAGGPTIDNPKSEK